ncbi:glycoside hydrolase family 76 protein [Haladaptatus salinisoli]|uniref:glycoside hydrolase family 76 protein n=1 Tax=Haladaptatus salinisoli TaxID=2884876 RepID=UPI001D0A05E1|nr:glycoside hydrolase family 76 protein [Haladaptatus salinisoli]
MRQSVTGTSVATSFALPLVAGNVRARDSAAKSGHSKSVSRLENVNRAITAYDALQQYFYEEDSKLYLEEYPNRTDNPYSYVWPFSQAMAGTIDLFGIRNGKIGGDYADDVQDRLDALELYWNPNKDPKGYDSYVRPPYGGGGDIFYDDNEWIGLELIQLYRMTDDRRFLKRARQIFDLVVHGWDDDHSHPKPGGVFWTQADWSDDRNTVSNAPGAELGLHLYQLSDDDERKQYYLSWSKRMYNWVNEHLQAPNGLYWDHVNMDGTITKWIFTYNQGTMIGVNVLLYEVTKDEYHLAEAERIADRALEYFGRENRLFEEDMAFSAIFFKNLLLLRNVKNNPKYLKAMQKYADQIWQTARDPATNLIKRGDATTHLLQQSAFVQINASLAWVRPDYVDLA